MNELHGFRVSSHYSYPLDYLYNILYKTLTSYRIRPSQPDSRSTGRQSVEAESRSTGAMGSRSQRAEPRGGGELRTSHHIRPRESQPESRVTGRRGVAARSCEEMPILPLRTLKYCPLPQVTPIRRGQSVPTPPSTFLVSSLARDDSHSHSPETYCKRVRRDERNT